MLGFCTIVICMWNRHKRALHNILHRFHIIVLYPSQPIWLFALCSLYVGNRYMLQTQFYVSRTGHILGHILYHCCTLHTALYHFAHYILSILGYVGLHDCNLYVKTGTNRALHNIYIGFSYYFSYHSQPIWLCALCSLYGGTGTCCKTYMARIETHIISLMIIWLHVM